MGFVCFGQSSLQPEKNFLPAYVTPQVQILHLFYNSNLASISSAWKQEASLLKRHNAFEDLIATAVPSSPADSIQF